MNNVLKVSFSHKIVVCFITALVAAYPLIVFNDRLLSAFKPMLAIRIVGFVAAVSLISFIFIWQILEKRNALNPTKTLGFVQAVLIYALSFTFMKWGLLKILHLHVTTSLGWMEMPMTMLSGEKQLSHFFGQNYPLVVVLGLCEITGSVLILFRKTRLMGLFILFVMTSNIILFDYLYDATNPITEAIILLCGILYLAFQDYEKIIRFFFKTSEHLPRFTFGRKWVPNLIKMSAILLPMLLLIPNYKTQFRPNLTGKYSIKRMTVNGKEMEINVCSDTTFSHVYFDLGDYFILTNKSFKRIQVGHFEINEATRQFKTVWESPKGLTDTLFGSVSPIDAQNNMLLTGIMGKDTLRMELTKVEIKNFTRTY
jgi:hypothetical protein